MTLPDALALAVVVLALPVVSFVTWQTCRLSDSLTGKWVLRWVAVSSLSLQLIVAVFAAIFVNNSMPHPPLNGFTTAVITRSAVLALVIPALYWRRQSRR